MPKESRPALERNTEESAAKKRRPTKIATAPHAVVGADLYTSVVEYEEKESLSRNADEDAKLYYKTCGEIRNLIQEIAELKKISDNEKIREKTVEASMKILVLKKLNRLEKIGTKRCRDDLQKASEQVECDYLHLQNLFYEAEHLNKEVQKCLEFKSKDEELDLVPVEEFYAEAPVEISKPDITKSNPHELKLARLQWELKQRKSLAEECKKLEDANNIIGKDIENLTDKLNHLDPALKTVLDSTEGLQDNLGIKFNKMEKLAEIAMQLPEVLYVLFVQADAYSKVANWVSVSIIGECDKTPEVEESPLDDISSADSDSDELNDSTHRRKTTFQDRRTSVKSKEVADRVEQRKKECFKKHSLSVLLKITTQTGEVISLEFQWLTVLEIICVESSVTLPDEMKGVGTADLFCSRHLLNCLFPGDTGEISPNVSTNYHLHRAGLDTFPTNIPNLGRPFNWAQKAAGLVFLPESYEVQVQLCSKNLVGILKTIRKRCTNRFALAKETSNLEKEILLCDEESIKLKNRKFSFLPITMADYQKVPSFKHFENENIIDNNFLFFKITIQCPSSAKLIAYVAVPPNYSTKIPIILTEFGQGNHLLNSLTAESLFDIEREINHFVTVDPPFSNLGILTNQIIKLFLCLEVYLVTEVANVDGTGAVPLDNPVKGRNRIHPYRYTDIAGGLFTHR